MCFGPKLKGYVTQCPICFSRVSKQPLARVNIALVFLHCLTPGQHLKKIHGITDPVAEAGPLTVSIPTYTNDTAESLHVRYMLQPLLSEN